MSTHKGSCLCRAVQYEITMPEGAQHVLYNICHCKDCQKWSGSAFASNLILPAESMKLTKGAEGKEVKVYTSTATSSGNPLEKYFCSLCGSGLYIRAKAAEKIVVVTSGTLDDPVDATIQPMQETFCVDRRQWLKPIEGLKQFERMFDVQHAMS